MPVPQRLAINPRVLDTSLLPEKALSSTSNFFPTPLDNVIPPATLTMETRLLHGDKELSHQQGSSMPPCLASTRAMSRGGCPSL